MQFKKGYFSISASNVLSHHGSVLSRHVSVLSRHVSVLSRHVSFLSRHVSVLSHHGSDQKRAIYITEKFWHGSNTNGTDTKKCKVLHHLHGSFSTVITVPTTAKSYFGRVLGSRFGSAF